MVEAPNEEGVRCAVRCMTNSATSCPRIMCAQAAVRPKELLGRGPRHGRLLYVCSVILSAVYARTLLRKQQWREKLRNLTTDGDTHISTLADLYDETVDGGCRAVADAVGWKMLGVPNV